MIKYFKIFLLPLALSSCSSYEFRVLEPKHPDIKIELMRSRGLFPGSGGFELRISNGPDRSFRNCRLEFNGNLHHSLFGLHTVEKGMVKDSTFRPGEKLTIKFGGDVDNLIYFKADEGFIPESISLVCDSCDVTWKAD